MLPLYQFPNIAAWRTDQVGGPVDKDAANYQAFQNINAVGQTPTVMARSSSVPSSGQSASTRSPSAPTRRGTCGPRHSRCCRACGHTTAQGTYEATQLVTGEPDVALG